MRVLSMKGRHHSSETILKLHKIMNTPEVYEKLRLASSKRKGWHHSAEAIEKIRRAKSTSEQIEISRRANLGKHPSPETIEKMREASQKVHRNPETREKARQLSLGRKHSAETIEKMRRARRTPEARERMRQARARDTPEVRERLRQIHIGTHPTEETLEKMRHAQLGRRHTPETIEKMRQSQLGRHQHLSPEHKERLRKARTTPEAIKKWSEGLRSKTKPEKHIDRLLGSLYPNEFKYNGRYECGITIDGLIPDFVNVNGKKQVIEVFGRYWHPDANEVQEKQERYAKYGYPSLIIWDYELKDEKAVIQKIVEFVGQEPHLYFETKKASFIYTRR